MGKLSEQDGSILPALISRKKKIAWSRLTKFVIFWTKTAMEAQKQAKDSENKENLTESGSCVYCATNTVGFVPGSLLFPSHC